MSMFLAFFWLSVDVASTCSTSEVPMPNASEPNAPCVAVCESPHTHVLPGTVKPCSGPMICGKDELAASAQDSIAGRATRSA
eukprot:6111397-Prymnesium_polylepis.1